MHKGLVNAAHSRFTSSGHPTSRAAKHTIQTKLATDASAIESRAMRAIIFSCLVPLMFYIPVLFLSVCQGDKGVGRKKRTYGTIPQKLALEGGGGLQKLRFSREVSGKV
jgi:hypothetical protein